MVFSHTEKTIFYISTRNGFMKSIAKKGLYLFLKNKFLIMQVTELKQFSDFNTFQCLYKFINNIEKSL